MINYKKPAFPIITIAVFACIITVVCLLTKPYSDDDVDDNQSEFHSFTENQDGSFTADNGKTYKYKLKLVGRSPNAICDAYFIVLSNDKDLTFERVNESLFTSNSERFLNENAAIIISMGTLESANNVHVPGIEKLSLSAVQ